MEVTRRQESSSTEGPPSSAAAASVTMHEVTLISMEDTLS